MSSILKKASPLEQLKELKRGAVEVLPEDELLKKLENSYNKEIPLIVKLGADPSRPDIHLGHTVILNKLRVLQEFGHEIQFLIGDFTARIGDPTGRSKVRQQLTEEEVLENSKSYKEQVFKILDPDKTKVVYNSSWLDPIALNRFLQILMTTTVGQLIARDDFTTRFEANQPIYMHEFLYPMLQGYDSVAMKSDIELGGTDQKFNLLMGRHLQKCFGVAEQALIIMPILEGLDGVQKMSKSYDNYIGLNESPKDMFGKLMSISDELMLRYYDLLSSLSVDEVSALKNKITNGELHPMLAKKLLAQEIVDQFHGRGKGQEERDRFEEFFSKRKVDDASVPVVQLEIDEKGEVNLITFLVSQGFAKSRTDARRLIQQRAVKLNNEAILTETFHAKSGEEYLIRSGKLHLVKIKIS